MGLALRSVDDDGVASFSLGYGKLHVGGKRCTAQAADSSRLNGRHDGRRVHAFHILAQGMKIRPFIPHVVLDGNGHRRRTHHQHLGRHADHLTRNGSMGREAHKSRRFTNHLAQFHMVPRLYKRCARFP
ncbi:hypothetical protein SDC9_197151 [bioreactor metagenome]|uniref:Uncharacterized protein n=1 Tax=bioreactor metagenome TaxID=1076179 RepID=A0A645IEH8_9ZZZZ